MKTEILQIRISQTDKEKLKRLANEKEMSMSELIVYLIRREAERGAE